MERSRDSEQGWLDLQDIATVEVTSEDSSFPIEAALNFEFGLGWRATEAGEQHIRMIFDHPPIRRIQLHFVETAVERTQEFTLGWSSASGGPMKEIVRHQWNFNPTGCGIRLLAGQLRTCFPHLLTTFSLERAAA
jgi:hypothetical protein